MFALFRSTIYVRLKPDRLAVRHVESGREYANAPVLAIGRENGKRAILAVGREALAKKGLPEVEVVNGFSHPRTLIADFTLAEHSLKYFMKKVPARSFLASPIIVMHPQAVLDGGLTQIEIRALAELAHGLGARRVFVWRGAELSPEELKELRFPPNSGQLLYP